MNRVLAFAPAVVLLAACGRIDQVDVVRSASATLPAAPPGGAALPPGVIATLPIALGRDALSSEGVNPNAVDSAKLVGLRLEVTQGTSLDQWADALSVFVEAPGLPRVLVAQKSGIRGLPAGTTRVDLDTPGVDLKPYVLAQTTSVTAQGAGAMPAAETTIQATATLRVDVNVKGLLQ